MRRKLITHPKVWVSTWNYSCVLPTSSSTRPTNRQATERHKKKSQKKKATRPLTWPQTHRNTDQTRTRTPSCKHRLKHRHKHRRRVKNARGGRGNPQTPLCESVHLCRQYPLKVFLNRPPCLRKTLSAPSNSWESLQKAFVRCISIYPLSTESISEFVFGVGLDLPAVVCLESKSSTNLAPPLSTHDAISHHLPAAL